MEDIQAKIIIALVSIICTWVIREWFARRREERDRTTWQFSNLKDFYFDQYLCEEVKKPREKLQSNNINKTHHIQNFDDERDRISKAMQRIGAMVYVGGIPLSYVLIMNSYQIVSDWLLVFPFIRKIRKINSSKKNIYEIPFHRRHAEWISLISWMWISSQKYSVNSETTKDMVKFKEHFGSYWRIAKREKLLFQSDEMMVSKDNVILRRKIRHDFLLNLVLIKLRFKKGLTI